MPDMSVDSIYLGIDCGATTSKVSGIGGDVRILSDQLRQRPTESERGPEAIIKGWVTAASEFLDEIGYGWSDVEGLGLAIPGPYLGYGILGRMPNMPASLTGWRFRDDLESAIQKAAGRKIEVVTANDGLLAGMAEARLIQAQEPGGVVMLAPGSGLGCSYVDGSGRLLSGDHQSAVIFCHMPAPYQVLGLPRFSCGCGRDWGCYEAYTSISGLPQYLHHLLPRYPSHPLSEGASTMTMKEKVLSLRGLAQSGDSLALKIFDLQARAMGLTVAAACMAYDPSHVVIGGGLIDPDATTEAFRARYLSGIRNQAGKYLWVELEKLTFREASLGELSQAIGAAFLAMSRGRERL